MIAAAAGLVIGGVIKDKEVTARKLRRMKSTGTFIEMLFTVQEMECFMPGCLNNSLGFCQCKPDNITPGDLTCAKLIIAEV